MVFEVRFYLIVAVLLLLGRGRIGTSFAIWAALEVIIVTLTSYGFLPMTWFTYSLTLEFVMGAAVGALIVHRVDIAPRVALTVGAMAFLFTVVFLYSPEELPTIRLWGYGLPAALMLYGLVTMEARGAIRTPRALVALGEASYSLYLWHFPVQLIVQKYWQGLTWIDGLGFIASSIPVLAIVTYLSYVLIERPLISGARRTLLLVPSFSASLTPIRATQKVATKSRA